MSIVNATTARNNFFRIIDEAIMTHNPVTVTGKAGNVVIISEEDFSAIKETMYISGIPGLRERIIIGLNTKLDDCVEDSQDA